MKERSRIGEITQQEGRRRGMRTRDWREQGTEVEHRKDYFFLVAFQVLVGPRAHPQAA